VVEVNVPGLAVKFHEIATREMKDFGKLDCRGLSNQEIVKALTERLGECRPAGKIIRVKLAGIPRSQSAGLDYRIIRSAAEGAVHFEVRIEPSEESLDAQAGHGTIGELRSEFGGYLDGLAIEGLDKAELLKLGQGYIHSAMEPEDG
jgi:hypothetical protein